jgi:LysM repeat protein
MKGNPEVKTNDSWSDDSTYSTKRKRIGSGDSKSLYILLGILLIVVFAGGIFYFITRRSTEGDAKLQSKMAAFEQKITSLERQITDLQGKLGTAIPDPALLQRVDALADKVDALGKKQPIVESKAKPSAPSKPAVSTKKQYHTVQKGETLYRVSKKYGISVEEIRKLNNLSGDQPLRSGQKLLVSHVR